MPSGSWNCKGVSIQSSDLSDAGYAYQSLYQPVVKGTYQHHENQSQRQQSRDGFSLESHHFMDLSQVLKEVEDEGSLIPSPTRLAERKRRLSNESLSGDEEERTQHASIQQMKNTFSISLDSLNENHVDSSSRVPPESCRIEYDSDKTPTVDRSFWSESDDDSPVVEGIDDPCYYDENDLSYHHALNISGAALETPTNLNSFLQSSDQDVGKEIRNIGVVTDDFELNNDLEEDYIDEQRSYSSQDAASSASSESLRSAYSLQTPALSSSPESYEMLYRSFEVAAMMEKEHRKNGVDLDPPEESSLDILNKTSPKLQRMNYQRGGERGSKESSDESNLSPVAASGGPSNIGLAAGNQSEIKWFDHRPSTLDFGSNKAHSAEDISSSKVITFAQLAQQRKKPVPAEVERDDLSSQESLPHWTELLSVKGATCAAQDIPGKGAKYRSQEQLLDAPRRPQSLPIQLRHLQKPTIRPHVTPPQHPRCVTRTLSAPEGFTAGQRTSKSWGEHDEGIGELSESEADELSPDPMEEAPVRDVPTHSLPPLLRQEEIEFGGPMPRRHRTTTWCGSFATSRRSLLGSREHLSDTDSLDSWQPPPTDINANIASNGRSPNEGGNVGSVSALYNARSMPLNASLCRKNFQENIQRSRKRHYCKDTYAERMLQHGGVFISGTENKPFLLQDIDSSKPKVESTSVVPKTRSLPRNMGVARRRNGASASSSGKSRPKSMEGLPSFSHGMDIGNFSTLMPHSKLLNKSKSQEDTPSEKWTLPPVATSVSTATSTVASVSTVQQQWEASDAADYASLNSCLLKKSSPSKETRVTCEELQSSGDDCDLFPPSSRRIIRIENVARDAEVKYIKHRPLKPIHVVDAEHHRKKVLQRLANIQPPASAPPTGAEPRDRQPFSNPTVATGNPLGKGHCRQKSDATASITDSQSQSRRESFWAWATGRQPIRAKITNKMDESMLVSGSPEWTAALKSKMRPLNLRMDSDDWDNLDSMPPQVMKVSPRDEASTSSIDAIQKKALVAEVNAAVDQLLAHFAQAKAGQPKDKVLLGDSWKTPDVGHLALHYLCPALLRILQDGLRPHSNSLLVGRIRNTTWTTVEATTQIGPGTRILHELASTISRDIRLKDSKLRTHAFFLGLLNIRCVETWLEHIKTHPDIIRRLYEPTAFLSLCNSAPFEQLFSDLLVAVQPLAELPFNLDHGFEYGYIQAEAMRQREKQQLVEQHGGASLSSLHTSSLTDTRPEGWSAPSGFPTVHLFGRAPRREETNPARPVNTGMYSSMTLMRNARKVSPVGRPQSSEQPATSEGLLRTANSTPAENVSGDEHAMGGGQRELPAQNSQSTRWSLGWIKEFASSVATQPERVPVRRGSNVQSSNPRYSMWGSSKRSMSVDMQQTPVMKETSSTFSSGWGKLGASFSKMWNQMMPSQPQQPEPRAVPCTPPPTPAREEQTRMGGDGESGSSRASPTSPKTSPGSPVKALCHHVSMTEGELCFSKGDVLTVNHQVDPEWLLCSRGEETGLVHIEYVQGME
ncbi:uncharacterized protein [Diadema setosum]|uniref:uncharacterized protein n=1 Tax=Diadema setosum TaxID=31175 RepID=UPI003B3A861E